MKLIKKFSVLAVLAIAFFQSCKKDENKIYFEGGTAPVLTASTTDPLILLKNNKDLKAITFNWTNPDYRFTTGVSSQDVKYILQVDRAGKNFASTNIQEQSIASDLAVSFTVKELNAFLVKMELPAGVEYDMEMRIKSTLGNGSVPLYSNVIKLKITPYLDFAVEPPGELANNYEDGQLWLVGDAAAGGWNNPLQPPYNVTQKFTRVDVLHYVDTITFLPTGGYKLIQKPGDWSTQYHALDNNAKLEGSFEKKDSDPQFPSPGAGDYRVEVNFQTGKYKLTKL